MTVPDALRGVRRLGLDTPPIIYFVEQNATYHAVCEQVFLAVDAGSPPAVTSTLSLTESLVKPLRTGNTLLIQGFEELLTPSDTLDVLPVTAAIAKSAADLRARYNLRTADALQVAAVISAGCDAFLTGDKDLRRVVELKVIILDDLTP